MRSNLFWLSDEQWSVIQPLLPTDVRGKERVDDRRVISGIIFVIKSGCRWCDCPEAYGPYTTIYNRFVRWARRGIWENLFWEMAGNGRSAETQMIDSEHPLDAVLTSYAPGQTVRMEVIRDGDRIEISVTLGIRPPDLTP